MAAEFDGLISCWCIVPGTLSCPLSLDYGPFFRWDRLRGLYVHEVLLHAVRWATAVFCTILPASHPLREASRCFAIIAGLSPPTRAVSCCSRSRHVPPLSASIVSSFILLYFLFPASNLVCTLLFSPCTTSACFCFVSALLRCVFFSGFFAV